MLSKNTIKLVKSLQLKKNRIESGLFLVEGVKSILELFKSDFNIFKLIGTDKFIQTYYKELNLSKIQVEQATIEELSSIGTFSTNDSVLAIVEIKSSSELIFNEGELVIGLDTIQDPGNLGTIIRTADWFGIKKIWCSTDCVDFYNPKTIAATMGSFTRVQVEYCKLEERIKKYRGASKMIFGADMDGIDISKIENRTGILILGNEANGLSQEIEELITQKISIKGHGSAESLNVAIASAIILYEFTKK